MLQSSLRHISSAPEVDCLAFARKLMVAGVRSSRLSTSTAFLLPQVSTAPLFTVQTRAAGVTPREKLSLRHVPADPPVLYCHPHALLITVCCSGGFKHGTDSVWFLYLLSPFSPSSGRGDLISSSCPTDSADPWHQHLSLCCWATVCGSGSFKHRTA